MEVPYGDPRPLGKYRHNLRIGGSRAGITRCRTAWRKFRDTLPLLMNRGISLDIRESIYTSYKCGAMLYGRMQVLGDEERRACKVQKKRAPLC